MSAIRAQQSDLGTRYPQDLHHTRIPVPRRWARAGRTPVAYLWLDGKRHFLGPWQSAEADAVYREFVRRFLAETAQPSTAAEALPDTIVPVQVLRARYEQHVKETYRKRGRPTSTVLNVCASLAMLYRAGLTSTTVAAAGPVWLKSYQTWLAGHTHQRWARRTINQYVSIVVQMFAWGVSEQMVTPDQLTALETVRPLRKGSTPGGHALRDGNEVMPVDRQLLQRSRRFLPLPVRVMVDLQLVSGMRPIEVCAMRPCHLRRTSSANVIAYEVPAESNKTEHLEIERTVFLGPRAQRLMRMVQPAVGSECYFSPAKTAAWVFEQRAQKAQHKREAWQNLRLRCERRRAAGVKPASFRDQYTSDSYRRVISRACAKAFGEDEYGRPRQWWNPNELRHTRASIVASRRKVQDAQRMLGHKHLQTTMLYVQVEDRKAVAIAAAMG